MKNVLWGNINLQKGQSLIEAVAALAVVTIVLTALTIAVLLGLRNSEFTRKETIATQYAQQGMEIIRNKRDVDWGTFNNYTDAINGCLGSGNTFTSFPCVDSQYITIGSMKFMRTVNFASNAGCGVGNKKVTVMVAWKDSKCPSGGFCKKASIVSCFSDLRAPTP